MGYLPRRTANRMEPTQEKEACCTQVERSWRTKEHFDIRHGDAQFGVCPAGFQSYFGPVFPYYVPFPPFWDNNVYPVSL